jgi:hypothetical protein
MYHCINKGATPHDDRSVPRYKMYNESLTLLLAPPNKRTCLRVRFSRRMTATTAPEHGVLFHNGHS